MLTTDILEAAVTEIGTVNGPPPTRNSGLGVVTTICAGAACGLAGACPPPTSAGPVSRGGVAVDGAPAAPAGGGVVVAGVVGEDGAPAGLEPVPAGVPGPVAPAGGWVGLYGVAAGLCGDCGYGLKPGAGCCPGVLVDGTGCAGARPGVDVAPTGGTGCGAGGMPPGG